MLTRFSCNSSNYGQLGFINAVIATATASANSTPSTPTGCNSFEVLGNTVAGGWTKIDPADGSENNTTTLTLCAASPKAFTDGTKKAIRFYMPYAQGYSSIRATMIQTIVGRATSANAWIDGTTMGYASTTTSNIYSSFAAKRRPWFSDTAMGGDSNAENHGDFLCAATAEYLWLFWGPTYETSNGYEYNAAWYTTFGICDHTQGYNWEYAPNSLHCPWYGIGIHQRTNTNYHGTNNAYGSRDGKYMFGNAGFHRHVDFTASGNSTLMSRDSQNLNNGGGFTVSEYSSATYQSPYYKTYDNTGYGTSATYHNANSDFFTYVADLRHHFPNMRDYDNSGNSVQSINPLIVGQPSAGRPYREVKGIKQIGWATEAMQGQNALPYHMTDIQSNDNTPKNYRCFLSGGKMLWAFEKV